MDAFAHIRKAQMATLHGQRYRERDIVAKLHCPMIAVHNDIAKCNVILLSGRPWARSPVEDQTFSCHETCETCYIQNQCKLHIKYNQLTLQSWYLYTVLP